MAKIKFHNQETELLFVTGSTADRRGRRVICRYPGGVENTMFPETLTSEALETEYQIRENVYFEPELRGRDILHSLKEQIRDRKLYLIHENAIAEHKSTLL